MLDIKDFKKPLVTWQCGGPSHYTRRYPNCVYQIFPMYPLRLPPPRPLIRPVYYQSRIPYPQKLSPVCKIINRHNCY